MSTPLVSEEIRQAWIRLRKEIQETRSDWNDEVIVAFISRFIDPWECNVSKLLSSLESLEELMRKLEVESGI